MNVLIPAFAVAFAAFCVWLTVRIVNRRERWAKWTAVGLVMVFVGYPLSYGPACGLVAKGVIPESSMDAFAIIYCPMIWLITEGPVPVRQPVRWYHRLWQENHRNSDVPQPMSG
jgi:hypothetical protein